MTTETMDETKADRRTATDVVVLGAFLVPLLIANASAFVIVKGVSRLARISRQIKTLGRRVRDSLEYDPPPSEWP